MPSPYKKESALASTSHVHFSQELGKESESHVINRVSRAKTLQWKLSSESQELLHQRDDCDSGISSSDNSDDSTSTLKSGDSRLRKFFFPRRLQTRIEGASPSATRSRIRMRKKTLRDFWDEELNEAMLMHDTSYESMTSEEDRVLHWHPLVVPYGESISPDLLEMCYHTAWEVGKKGCIVLQTVHSGETVAMKQQIRILFMDGTDTKNFLRTYRRSEDNAPCRDRTFHVLDVRDAFWNPHKGSVEVRNVDGRVCLNCATQDEDRSKTMLQSEMEETTTKGRISWLRRTLTFIKSEPEQQRNVSVTRWVKHKRKQSRKVTVQRKTPRFFSKLWLFRKKTTRRPEEISTYTSNAPKEENYETVLLEGMPSQFLEAMMVCVRECDLQRRIYELRYNRVVQAVQRVKAQRHFLQRRRSLIAINLGYHVADMDGQLNPFTVQRQSAVNARTVFDSQLDHKLSREEAE